jgi:hypothetical protein
MITGSKLGEVDGHALGCREKYDRASADGEGPPFFDQRMGR